jgi:hypothetical protein
MPGRATSCGAQSATLGIESRATAPAGLTLRELAMAVCTVQRSAESPTSSCFTLPLVMVWPVEFQLIRVSQK